MTTERSFVDWLRQRSKDDKEIIVGSEIRQLCSIADNAITECEGLRLRLLSAAGDDLCRLTQEEIKAYTTGAVQIPPIEEFLPSCERFHAQIAAGPGVLPNCLTMAQLIAENEKLRRTITDLEARLAGATGP